MRRLWLVPLFALAVGCTPPPATLTTPPAPKPAAVKAPPLPDEPNAIPAADLAPLFAQLGDREYATREKATKALIAKGWPAVPALQAELETATEPEVIDRLGRVLGTIGKLDWHTNADDAVATAAKSGKPILVFSTIGDCDGYSCLASNLMRSSTFADGRVARTLQREFVLVWHNQHPNDVPPGIQAPATAEQIQAFPEGAGGSNSLTYVADASGRVAYKLTGYWRTERYLEELAFGREVAKKLDGKTTEGIAQVIGAEHDGRTTRIGELRAELARKHPEEFNKPVRESEVRKTDAALGLLEQSLANSKAISGKQTVTDILRAYLLERVIK